MGQEMSQEWKGFFEIYQAVFETNFTKPAAVLCSQFQIWKKIRNLIALC